MKPVIYFFLAWILWIQARGQQLYCNFEDGKVVVFKTWTGTLDTAFVNPDTTGIDTTKYCAKYVRKSDPYDNIKLVTYAKMIDANAYATASVHAPHIKLKIYSNMPVGSKVQLQLGSATDDNYPSGTHSEYYALTKKQYEWEDLDFSFSQLTSGGQVAATDVNKVILMFRPNSLTQDIIYFDDLKGPQLNAIGVKEIQKDGVVLEQNRPNPAAGQTRINFTTVNTGDVSLKLYDVAGNELISLLEATLSPGDYSVPLNTEKLAPGLYFYTLSSGGASRTYKMSVAK